MAKKDKVVAIKGARASKRLLTHMSGRRAAVQYYSGFGLQKVHTPFNLVTDMINGIGDLTHKTILVLFNLEIVEILYEMEIPMEQVSFIADTEQERRFVQTVYGVKATLIKEPGWLRLSSSSNKIRVRALKALEKLMAKMNAPADITITNPPYNGGIDLKIIMAMREANLLKRLVCVHPSTWLVDIKTQLPDTPVLDKKTGQPKLKKDGTAQMNQSGNSTFRKFQDTVRDHITSAELFNGNPVFGIGLFVPCVISDVNFGSTRKGAIKVKDVGEAEFREVLSIEDITLHGSRWDPTVKEFMGRVQAYCIKHGSLLKRKEVFSSVKKGLSYAQIAGIRGNVSSDTMIQDDFYTFVQKDQEENKGVRNEGDRMPLFSFSIAKERDYFLQYLQTDFARLCLSILKLKADLDRGEFLLVPWMDFTRSWTDDELFTELGYAKGHPIREYAKRFLPDYHGIYTDDKGVLNKTY